MLHEDVEDGSQTDCRSITPVPNARLEFGRHIWNVEVKLFPALIHQIEEL